MSKIWIFALCASLAFLSGCASDGGKKVTRLDANSVTDLSGSWNDTDSRLVAEEMINDCLGRPWYSQFSAQKGSVPTIVIGKVRNKSHEHIRVETFIKDIERALINSGKAEFVANSNERGDLRDELATSPQKPRKTPAWKSAQTSCSPAPSTPSWTRKVANRWSSTRSTWNSPTSRATAKFGSATRRSRSTCPRAA